jgi:NAD-dependent SIR2 family protein deacetylase
MTDIFDAKISCKNCDSEMQKGYIEKRGMQIRAVKCGKCGDKIIHPADLSCLENFKDLRGKEFNVKLRVVGNSHAISIPKEIVNFINDQHRQMNSMESVEKEMNDMVRLCLEDFHKLSLRFGE